MHLLCGFVSVALILVVFFDAFESMVVPRRITHRFRLARLYFFSTWAAWRRVGLQLPRRQRLPFLGLYGPLSVLGLFGLWIGILIFAFAMLHWSLATTLAQTAASDLGTFLYLSGVTFFTLGYGDIVAAGALGRVLAVVEAGVGFGFMAVVIGYLPVLYQAFSSRERAIQLLNARAGSPPTAAEFLLRGAKAGRIPHIGQFLLDWERWCAELLESQLSFPVLGYYRSQHDNQSWLAALTMMLDACAVLLAAVNNVDKYHARLTFAMGRHAIVDLALIYLIQPTTVEHDRLPREKLAELLSQLQAAGGDVAALDVAADKLQQLRTMYEPFAVGLAHRFLLDLPPIMPDRTVVDNWQTSPWMKRTPGLSNLASNIGEDHFG